MTLEIPFFIVEPTCHHKQSRLFRADRVAAAQEMEATAMVSQLAVSWYKKPLWYDHG
jgi:hypothetical protein